MEAATGATGRPPGGSAIGGEAPCVPKYVTTLFRIRSTHCSGFRFLIAETTAATTAGSSPLGPRPNKVPRTTPSGSTGGVGTAGAVAADSVTGAGETAVVSCGGVGVGEALRRGSLPFSEAGRAALAVGTTCKIGGGEGFAPPLSASTNSSVCKMARQASAPARRVSAVGAVSAARIAWRCSSTGPQDAFRRREIEERRETPSRRLLAG